MKFFTNDDRLADEYAKQLAETPDENPNELPDYLRYDYEHQITRS